MSTTPGPLLQLDRYRSLNRAPAWAPWLGDAPVVLAVLFGVACGSAFAAHALRSLHDTHDGLAVVALVFAAGWLGMRIGLDVPARRARVVFAGWLKVLPIPASTLLRHWRRTSVRHAGIVGVVAALACSATAGLAGMGAVAALLATGGLAATLVGSLAVALRSPPGQGSLQPHSTPRASTRGWMSRFDSSRMPHAGTWQLRRHWSRAGVVLSVAASAAVLVFASAWGQAQATALPVLVAGLLLAIVVFNHSLDCTLLCSPAVRLLPLSGLQKVSALVRLPALLMASHGIEVMAEWCTRIVRLDAGTLTESIDLRDWRSRHGGVRALEHYLVHGRHDTDDAAGVRDVGSPANATGS